MDMDEYIDELISQELGFLMEKSISRFMASDERYMELADKAGASARNYDNLDLTEEEKEVIGGHVADCISVKDRAAELGYVAGIKDCIRFLSGLGLLSGTCSVPGRSSAGRAVYTFHGKDISMNVFLQIQAVIHIIQERSDIDFLEGVDRFYRSKTYQILQDTRNGLWAESAEYIADRYFEEAGIAEAEKSEHKERHIV